MRKKKEDKRKRKKKEGKEISHDYQNLLNFTSCTIQN